MKIQRKKRKYGLFEYDFDHREIINSDMIIDISIKKNRHGVTGSYSILLDRVLDKGDDFLVEYINNLICNIDDK